MPPADVAQSKRIGPCGGVSLVLFVVVRGVILQLLHYNITVPLPFKIIFNIQQDFVVIYLSTCVYLYVPVYHMYVPVQVSSQTFIFTSVPF